MSAAYFALVRSEDALCHARVPILIRCRCDAQLRISRASKETA